MSLVLDWAGSAGKTEATIHQLSPYIGKTKSSMAASLIEQFTKKHELVYDPFSGSGTIALEAWLAQRRVIANDLSPYASLLTRAKLFPYRRMKDALDDLRSAVIAARKCQDEIDLRRSPKWVRDFFHPETLRETVAFAQVLKRRRRWFLLACLLGILHHQRPGFLSFPSSHTVPYLRSKKFPRRRFPELYEFRSLQDRLEAKVKRAFRRLPKLDRRLTRHCFRRNAALFTPTNKVDAIVTSPPYMRQLDYGRDNRLRLWFLGINDWDGLDKRVSPRQIAFLKLMRRCFTLWTKLLKPGRTCVLIIGDASSRSNREDLADTISRIATDQVGGYLRLHQRTDPIPNERRVRRGLVGSPSETILVLRRTNLRRVPAIRNPRS